MKKVFLGVIAIVGLLMVTMGANAQTSALKIGVIDREQIMQALPEFGKVDTALQIYSRDSIGGQYDIIMSEYKRLDSTYKLDSAAKATPTKLKYEQDERDKNLRTLLNWNQIAQQAQQAKYVQLAGPYYEKVTKALQQVCTARKIAFVIKPSAIEFLPEGSTTLEDLSIPVAKALGIAIPDENGAGGAQPARSGAAQPRKTGR